MYICMMYVCVYKSHKIVGKKRKKKMQYEKLKHTTHTCVYMYLYICILDSNNSNLKYWY